MSWSKPDFVEISLCMEVTGYVNVDEKPGVRNQESGVREQNDSAPSLTPDS
jgi:coenzyme PQQ precursor peptide PqqA